MNFSVYKDTQNTIVYNTNKMSSEEGGCLRMNDGQIGQCDLIDIEMVDMDDLMEKDNGNGNVGDYIAMDICS